MARPTKPEDDKRDVTIRVRVTASEKLRIWQQAEESGQTPSDYLRLKSLAASTPLRRVPTPDRKILLDALAELGKVGSNVNQIARALNRSDGRLPTGVSTNDIDAAMQGVDELTAHLLNLLRDGD